MSDKVIERMLQEPRPSAGPTEVAAHRLLVQWHKANPNGNSAQWNAYLRQRKEEKRVAAEAREAQEKADEDADRRERLFAHIGRPAPVEPPAPSSTRRARPRATSDSRPVKRAIWAYAPVPRAIIRDARLSPAEQLVAAGIADALNYGIWNKDMHVDVSIKELADRVHLSTSKVQIAVTRLQDLGFIEGTAMSGTAGTRFRFRMEALSIPEPSPTRSSPLEGEVRTDDGDFEEPDEEPTPTPSSPLEGELGTDDGDFEEIDV